MSIRPFGGAELGNQDTHVSSLSTCSVQASAVISGLCNPVLIVSNTSQVRRTVFLRLQEMAVKGAGRLVWSIGAIKFLAT